MLKTNNLKAAAGTMLAAKELRLTGLYTTLNCSQSMLSQKLSTPVCQGLFLTGKQGASRFCSINNDDSIAAFSCLEQVP